MKLYNIKTEPQTLIAEIDDNYRVSFLHPLLKRAIEIQKGAVIPAIKKLTDQFEGRTKIPMTDKKFGRALMIQLTFDYASHPSAYQWMNP